MSPLRFARVRNISRTVKNLVIVDRKKGGTYHLSTSKRFHALDSLRGFLMILGVFYHTAQHYSGEIHSSLNPEPTSSWFFFYFNTIIHLVRMPLFFAISGYLAGLLIDRKGGSWFLKNRFNRILLPLLLFLILLSPVVDYLRLWRGAQINGDWTEFSPGDLFLPDKLFHLWFLYYLVTYSTLLGIAAWFGDKNRLKKTVMLFSMTLITISIFMLFEAGQKSGWIELKTYLLFSTFVHPSHFCKETSMACFFHASTFWSYFLCYLLGTLIYKLDLQKTIAIRWWPITLLCAFLTFWLGYGISLIKQKVIVNILFCVLGSLSLLGAFLDKVSRESSFLRFLSDSSYWLYLAHYPLVILLCTFFIPINLFAWWKFIIISSFIVTLLLLSYNYLVRPSWLGALLNGNQKPPWTNLTK